MTLHPCPFRVGDSVLYKPSPRGLGLDVMSSPEGTRTQRRKTRYGSDTNLYGFEGLIAAATPYALEKIQQRAQRQQAEQDRVARKKPKLPVVS
jgi:hypothetical protein